jgi:TatD DNase family protein
MFFDSHAHFAGDPAAPLARAQAEGLVGLLAVGGSAELNAGALAAARHSPGFVRLALGWDRSHAARLSPESAAEGLAAESARCRAEAIALAAIGETGLDYHHDRETAAAQRALFERQVLLASEWELPLVVHSREADADTLAILRSAGNRALAAVGRLGVLHCFTGDLAFAEAVMDAGLCVSFSGIVTFRNADALRDVARHIPDDRLLIETDCPYLTPVPLRGQPNEPAFVKHVARCLATVRGVDEAQIAVATKATARRLFT